MEIGFGRTITTHLDLRICPCLPELTRTCICCTDLSSPARVCWRFIPPGTLPTENAVSNALHLSRDAVLQEIDVPIELRTAIRCGGLLDCQLYW